MMSTILRRFAALFLLAHGFAHVVGSLASWRVGEFKDAPYSTLILNGALDVGDVGIRLVGVLWAIAAVGFVWAAAALWWGSSRPVAPVTLYSLAVCLIGLPAAIIGVGVDVAILIIFVALAVVRPAGVRLLVR